MIGAVTQYLRGDFMLFLHAMRCLGQELVICATQGVHLLTVRYFKGDKKLSAMLNSFIGNDNKNLVYSMNR